MNIFDIELLSKNLQNVQEIDFSFLFGSAKDGEIKPGSDVDVAVYLNNKLNLSLLSEISEIIENCTGGECDLTVLNNSTAILALEAIKGKLLFVQEDKQEEYLEFCVYISRKHEDEIFELKQNLKYRGYK